MDHSSASRTGASRLRTNLSRVGDQWESLVNSPALFAAPPQHPILQSWFRCKMRGIDPYLRCTPKVLSADDTARLREQSELLRAAAPVLDAIAPIMIKAGYVLGLVDEEGTLLSVHAGRGEKHGLQQIGYTAGANWSEGITGTGGCATALVTQQPVLVVGSEHFCKNWHSWTCSAAPIFDSRRQRLVGALEAAQQETSANQCSLAAVLALAAAIEQQMEKLHWLQDRRTLDCYYELMRTHPCQAAIAVDHCLQIIQASPEAASLLGLDRRGRPSSSMCSLADIDPALMDLMDKGEGFEAPLVCSGREYWLTVHSAPAAGRIIVFDERRTRDRTDRRAQKTAVKYGFPDILGKSSTLQDALSMARVAAGNDLPVLICAESGTGKEMIAEAIHEAGPRSRGPFIAVNCAAIPPELMYSELFGYEEGAYTGAKRCGSTGKFEAANGGTLFLDEISELSPCTQAALLRVLQEMEITRLGSHRTIPLDVRVIAATNADLRQMVKEKRFRSDLLYRLDVFTIHVPPLRERPEDVRLLADAFLRDSCIRLRKPSLELAEDVVECLTRYAWPGNVRELKNVIQRAAALAAGPAVTLRDLPPSLQPLRRNVKEAECLRDQEKTLILRALEASPDNLSQVAARLGIGRTTLYRKLKKYGLERYWTGR